MGFTQGVSGLNAAARSLTTIGNNIANSKTVGYKSGRTEFADLFAGARGLGVQVSGVSQSFTGGPLKNTGRNLDLAIDGGGFFRLTDGSQTLFSRNGQFQQTKDGFIANAQGALLTGYNVSNFNSPGAAATIAAGGNPVPIQIPTEGLNAKATSQASLQAGLDAGAEIISAGFDPTDTASYNWSTPNTVFDSLGNAHSVNLYFTKTATNIWEVNGRMPLGPASSYTDTIVSTGGNYPGDPTVPTTDPSYFDPTKQGPGEWPVTTATGHTYTAVVTGATSDGATPPTYSGGQIRYVEQLDSITLTFDTNGNLLTAAGATKPASLANSMVAYSLNAQNGSAPIDFTFNFRGASQTAQEFRANSPQQNGYASGDLTGISVQDNGMVRGTYTNGQSINLAQVALASFDSRQGLQSVGGNAWIETAASGQPAIGIAGSGQFGSLLGGTLEGSNVDLSEQLVKMIVAQRTYQANAQTIKTQDQILQTAVNLAR